MNELTIQEMQDMQKTIHERYRDKWETLSPQAGRNHLLWMLGEVGEVIDVVKKRGDAKIMQDSETRHHFIEEMADVMMYYTDVLLDYGVTEEEFAAIYRQKFERNLHRF